MADTPKSSSTENPILDSKKSMTFGDLYTRIQSESILTPEQEVALRKKVVDKYGMLGLIQKRKETIWDNTRGELEELLADMPGKSDILAKLEWLLPGKPKTVEVAQDATKKATELAKSGVEGVKNLTPENMQAAVSKLWDNFSAGTAVLATAWAAVMAAPTIEWKAKALDGVMSVVGEYWEMAGNFLSNILAAIAAFFSGKFSESFDKLKWAFGMWEKKDEKTLAEEAKKKGEKIADTAKEEVKKVPEKMEILRQKYWESFVKSGWVQDPQKQKAKFEEIFEKNFKKWVISAAEVAKNATDSGSNWHFADSAIQVTTMPFALLSELIWEGVIPKSAIAAEVVDSSVAGLRLYIRSPYSLITKWPSQTLIDLGTMGDRDFVGMSEAQKQLTITAMHHTMTGPLWLAGKMSSSIAKVFFLWSHQGIGIEKIKALGQNMTWDFSKAADRMTYIMGMLGDQSGKADLQAYKDLLQKMTDETIFKTQVAESYARLSKSGKTPWEIAQALEAIPGFEKLKWEEKFQSMLTEIRTVGKDPKAALWSVTQFLKNRITPWVSLTWMDDFKRCFKSNFNLGDLTLVQARALEQMESHTNALAKMVQSYDTPVVNFVNKLRLWISQGALMDAFEKWHLQVHVANAKEAKSAMEQLIKWIPKWFEHAFNGIAVSLIVADVAHQDSVGDGLWALAKGVASMNPLFGGGIMLYEGTTMQWSIPTKAGYLVLGWVVTAIGLKDLAKLVANPSGARLLQFGLSPLYSVANTATAAVRWVRYAGNMVRFAPGVTRIPMARAGWWMAAGAVLGYLAYEKIISDKTKKTMETAWFFDAEWKWAEGDTLKTAWARVPSAEQPKVLSEIFAWLFPQDVIQTTVSDSSSVIIHAKPSKNSETTPITLDTFDAVRSMYESLGISDPKIFMSESTTKSVKQAIALLPVSDDQKKEFLSKFIKTA
jgi:hypothetical protein